MDFQREIINQGFVSMKYIFFGYSMLERRRNKDEFRHHQGKHSMKTQKKQSVREQGTMNREEIRMKNVQRTMARGGLAFAICYLLFASCTDPLLKPLTDTEPSAPGMGRITITHDESSDRTLLPNAPVFVSYTLSFTYQGEGEVNKDSETVTALPRPNWPGNPSTRTTGASARRRGYSS